MTSKEELEFAAERLKHRLDYLAGKAHNSMALKERRALEIVLDHLQASGAVDGERERP